MAPWTEIVAAGAPLTAAGAPLAEATPCIVTVNTASGAQSLESRLGPGLRNLARGIVTCVCVPGADNWGIVRAYPGGLHGFASAVSAQNPQAIGLLAREVPTAVTFIPKRI